MKRTIQFLLPVLALASCAEFWGDQHDESFVKLRLSSDVMTRGDTLELTVANVSSRDLRLFNQCLVPYGVEKRTQQGWVRQSFPSGSICVRFLSLLIRSGETKKYPVAYDIIHRLADPIEGDYRLFLELGVDEERFQSPSFVYFSVQ